MLLPHQRCEGRGVGACNAPVGSAQQPQLGRRLAHLARLGSLQSPSEQQEEGGERSEGREKR